ncbi:TonB family protein [Rhizobium bangladeshense]|uniref:TonB family protein n=1 Tax=Rhizobium bangladeshense TaxID=1138189 RepID=A0ABS7LAR6_9HYPH|nr:MULTISPECIES: TonB family protein [Rhizobium]MBX4866427.1 TonB family protein [Rhizobium bangladeshense]MBX4873609.1 TonB family protein [Rhizobium bangladeshense]MBX4885467.1 TonB family protein [Rhizobium bangladeshense]MBY3588423.1 TonB family protein [Rhizobium bangladeshense]TLX04875.1 TonB family protein [Rhizobium sp. MHM7A]
MATSAKSRSRHVLVGEESADIRLNDNMPGMHPGHELPELRNAQRQPAGETVIHYTRSAQISSFPDHPEAEPAAPASAPPMDAAVDRREDEQKPVRRQVALTCAGSFFFHVALAAALLVVMPKPSEETLMEAGEAISVVMLGSSDVDQSAAGETDVTIQQEIVPEAVEPDEINPIETADVQPEAVQPTDAEPVEAVQPTQEITRPSAETVTAAEPEVLVSETPAETSVVQPMSTVVPEQPVDTQVMSAEPPVVAAMPEQEEIKPVETAAISPEPEQPAEIVTPAPKPKLEKTVEKKPVERKQPPKKAQGSEGDDKQEARRGAADGHADANSDSNSRTSGGRNGAGGASEANYKGKLVARLFRCVDRMEARYRTARASLTVRITVSRGGDITASGIVRGSSLPEVDRAALARVASCNLPAMPDDLTASQRTYTFPVEVTPR